MSLATRCNACGTGFRVVQDQLKVSEGWVRCGRCGEVFNALEGLFDLEREALPEWKPAEPRAGADTLPPAAAPEFFVALDGSARESAPPARDRAMDGIEAAAPPREPSHLAREDELPAAAVATPSAEPATGPSDLPGSDSPAAAANNGPDQRVENDAPGFASSRPAALGAPAPASPSDEAFDAHLFGARGSARRRGSAVGVDERDRVDFSDARFDSDLLAEAGDSAAAAEPARDPAAAGVEREGAIAPEFLQRAESQARWRRPRVRIALGALSVVLLAALVLQAGNHFRDVLAAQWPGTRTALASWCAMVGCTLEAPRRIDAISVESTALTRAPAGDAFTLGVTLKNRSGVGLATPAVDLTLTDSAGRLIARKALGLGDFNPAPRVLLPNAEVTLQALLSAGNAGVTGYSVEIFYP